MYYGKILGETVVTLIGAFVFAVLIMVSIIVVNLKGGVPRTMITGEVMNIEKTVTHHSEGIVTVADSHYSVAADGSGRIFTYNRAVFFKNSEDVVGIEIGDIVTVSGKLNGYSLFDGRLES